MVFFKFQCADDFQQLSADGHLVSFREVFDQLLGNGGRTISGVTAKKHIGAGAGRTQPIHTLMIVESLIFNGNGCVDQISWNFVISYPGAVFLAVEPLQFYGLPGIRVGIIDNAGLIQCKVFQGDVGLRNQNLLDIFCKNTTENQSCQQTYQQQCAQNFA